MKLVNHRLEKISKNIEDLNKTLHNVEAKSEFLDEINTSAKENDKCLEIKEDVPSDYVHPRNRKRISHFKKASMEKRDQNNNESNAHARPQHADKNLVKNGLVEFNVPENQFASGDNNMTTSNEKFDEVAFMKRLDELEALEEQEFEDALSENNSEDSGIDIASSLLTRNDGDSVPLPISDVTIKNDPNEHFVTALSSKLCSIQEADECDSDDKPEQAVNEPIRIKFKHTKNKSVFLIPKTDDTILHPGDIGREKTILKSILKPPSRHNSVSEPEDLLSTSCGSSPCSSDDISDHFNDLHIDNTTNKRVSFKTPIADSVVEKTKRNNNHGHKKKSKKKRVSKFKASRSK